MKQVPVYLSAQAEEDLEGIADFIFERSREPRIALGFVQRIHRHRPLYTTVVLVEGADL